MGKKVRFVQALALLCLLTLGFSGKLSAQNTSATWGANSNSAWYTGNNWVGGSYAGSQSTTTTSNMHVATFTSAFSGTTVGINMNTSSLNLGAVVVDNTRTTALNIGSSSSSGLLRLFGAPINSVPNTIIRHNGTGVLTLQASQAGPMGVLLGNTTENIVATDNTGNINITAILSGTGKLTKTGAGTGILTISGANTYSGGTTITSGSLALGAANALPTSGTVTFNGGTLTTGGFTQGTSVTRTLALSENSTLALGSTNHTIAFAASNALSWTAGKTLTITGWTGTVGAATTGTAGKVLVGTSTAGLTAAQLSQIKFTISSVDYSAIMLSTGEIVPAYKYGVTSISPASPIAGSSFSVTVQAQNYNGVAVNLTSASTFALSTNGTAGVIGGTTTGTIAAGTSSVTVSGVTLSSAGTGATITATRTSGENLAPGVSAAFTVTGSSSPVLTISGTPTAHGNICLGSSGSTVQYTINNTGSAAASGISLATSNPEFAFSGLSSTTIPASGSATFNVIYTPTLAGPSSGTITVTSSTSGSNSPTIGLTGSGASQVDAVVTTSAATAINNQIATLNGALTSLGSCPSTSAKGFVYSQTSVNGTPTNGGTGTTTTPVAGLTTGNYSLALTSLAPGTSYSFRAYALDGTTYHYGPVLTFTTLAAANHLAFNGFPATGNVGVALTSFTVEAKRPDNSTDTNYTGSVVLTKASGPGSISGTLTASAVAGVATFSNVVIDAAGTYTLHANSGTLTQATTGNVVITLAPVSIFANTITGTNPSTSNPYIIGQTFASNLTVSGISRGPGISAASANDRYSAQGWNSTSFDADDYFEFTLTPASGYEIDFSSFVYNAQASGSGPTSFAFRSSIDGFTANIGTATGSGTTISLSSFQQVQSAVTFRFYAYGASAPGGTFSINDFIFSGNVICKTPSAFTVTGGGSTCNSNGIPVGLSGSETGISYQLVRNGNVNVGSVVAGTGSALNFGNQAIAGTYTVNAINNSGTCNVTAAMTGNATITLTNATVWTGDVDTDWNTAGNWSCGSVPIITSDVLIPQGTPQSTITADAFANTITLQGGTLLTLLSGRDLTVNGAITSTGNFTIENNANLIQISNAVNSGVTKVKRNSSALMRQDYTLWSSPVIGQNLLPFSPATLVGRFYTFNSSSNQYNTVNNPNTTPFAEGVGYLIRMPNNHPTTATIWNGEFNGTLRNGPVSVSIAAAGEGENFHAVGNPYPSPIDMLTFVNDNEGAITGTLYFWRKTNSTANPTYSTWTEGLGFVSNGQPQNVDPNGIIRTGQGFIVESADNDASVNFNNLQRSGNNSNQFFRSANVVERHRVWLNATGAQGAFSQTLIGYVTGATLAKDNGIDGRFFNDGEIEFYSKLTEGKFAIQGRPLPFDAADVVPMGFKVTTAGTYAIAIDQADGLFASGQNVYLRDNLSGTVHNLNDGAYSFTSEAGVFESRFEVLYENSLGTNNPVPADNAVVVYTQANNVIINSGALEMSSVKVYDVVGKLLQQVDNIGANTVTLAGTAANQVMILSIQTTDGRTIIRKTVR
ncbi:autotransporter-associated beta strand repeat-containing protein [Flavobacterium sp.]|uniref:beta strand repeat-containing protein n=1 Tax=Flavobacterium sp. TaxID=239 RepID=UPI0025C42989|nr:autotransporter-associated beta strand repeat-containing protein [Flavobacterium sp.]